MQTRYMQFLAALRQAQTFLEANDAALGTINAGGARHALDASITQISAYAEAQDSHRIQVTGARTNELRLARALRRQNVRPIVKIARAKLPDVAQLSNVKLLPGNINTTELVERARATANAVAPYSQTFVDAGLPTDFIDRLNTATDQLVIAISTKGDHRAKRQKSTIGITQEVRQARQAVHVLDALVKAQLKETEPLVSEWDAATRVIGSRSAAAAPAGTAPAPTPTTSPAMPASPSTQSAPVVETPPAAQKPAA